MAKCHPLSPTERLRVQVSQLLAASASMAHKQRLTVAYSLLASPWGHSCPVLPAQACSSIRGEVRCLRPGQATPRASPGRTTPHSLQDLSPSPQLYLLGMWYLCTLRGGASANQRAAPAEWYKNSLLHHPSFLEVQCSLPPKPLTQGLTDAQQARHELQHQNSHAGTHKYLWGKGSCMLVLAKGENRPGAS
ncbi:hypothetical protein NDU88_011412 [Pleurodeles waltl]|uniref:Uncharacterized protein n=1 Tax=Pleurodeles waltl TaxID=8319 RepID=A0AAV7Q1M6_PLEWA|nr:hypothetical protein NDU88_011412 [Pleurodeles waltl]